MWNYQAYLQIEKLSSQLTYECGVMREALSIYTYGTLMLIHSGAYHDRVSINITSYPSIKHVLIP